MSTVDDKARSSPVVIAFASAFCLLVGSTVGVFSYLVDYGRGWSVVRIGFGVLLVASAFGWIWALVRVARTRSTAVFRGALLAVVPAVALFFSTLIAPGFHGTVRFWLLRPLFEQAVQFAQSEDLPIEKGDFTSTAGQLPAHLCVLGRQCYVEKFAPNGNRRGPTVIFVYYEPTSEMFAPDSPYGYGYFAEPPDRETSYGPWSQSWVCPTIELGGGWWWMERFSCEL